jgi:hypothetical protein
MSYIAWRAAQKRRERMIGVLAFLAAAGITALAVIFFLENAQ